MVPMPDEAAALVSLARLLGRQAARLHLANQDQASLPCGPNPDDQANRP